MKNKNTQEPLKSTFIGAATGAVSGIIFGGSVEFLSDTLGKFSFSMPELLFNGFLLGTIPAMAMAGSAYIGSKALNKDNTLNGYATTHIIAVALAASVALHNDIGSIHDGSSYMSTRSPTSQANTLNGLANLLRAFNF